MIAVLKREFKSYFTNPIGWVILAVFTFFVGMFFSVIYKSGTPSVEGVVSVMSTIAIFATPFITMRLLSEDRRQKVDQVLLTSPVSLWGLVFGKFFATLAIFMMGYSMTIVFQIIIVFQNVTINWLVYIANILGIALMGSALIALGIFISSMTENQLVAAVVSFTVSFLIYMLDNFASMINNNIITKVVGWVSFVGRYNTFVEGVIDYSNAIFFLGFAAIFIFLTVRVLEKRRYS